MSETVKLIIEIPKVPKNDHERWVLAHGIPLDNDSDRAEAQAYFDGQAYGWEQGRKALIDDIKAEIKRMDYHMFDCDVLVSQEEVLEILEKYKKEGAE